MNFDLGLMILFPKNVECPMLWWRVIGVNVMNDVAICQGIAKT